MVPKNGPDSGVGTGVYDLIYRWERWESRKKPPILAFPTRAYCCALSTEQNSPHNFLAKKMLAILAKRCTDLAVYGVVMKCVSMNLSEDFAASAPRW